MGIEKFKEYLDGAVSELSNMILDILIEGSEVIVIYKDNEKKDAYLEFHDDRAEEIFLELIKNAGEGNGPAIRLVERFKAILFEKAETM